MAEEADGIAIESLRAEVLESQKIRTDMMKYKLIVCAVLAGVAMGISPELGAAKQLPWALVICPLVCLYIDAMCAHNQIRILVVAAFMKHKSPTFRSYEEWCGEIRGVFHIEGIAIYWSSTIIAALIGAYGITGTAHAFTGSPDVVLGWALISAAIIGIGGTWFIWGRERLRLREMGEGEMRVFGQAPVVEGAH